MAESIVTLRVEARNAISSLNRTNQATKTLSNSAKGATTSLTATSAAAKGLGASLATSLAPLLTVGAAVATVGNAIRTFQDRQRDVDILRQGLINLGEGTFKLNELQEAADKLGNQTLFNQEEFTRGFNLLTSFRKIGVDSYERVAQAAADIAQVNQVDVNTSFMQLAKALQDPERNLSNLNRSGIAFTKTQQDVIKELMNTNKTAEAHSMILQIVEESYNGLSQAAAEGFAGNVDSLGEAFRDFSETLGKALEPALNAATKGLTQLIIATNNFIQSPIGKTALIFTAIALAAKAIPVLLAAVSAGLIQVAAAGGVATIALNAIPFVAIATGLGLLTTALISAADEQRNFNQALKEGDEQALKSEFNRLFIERQKLLQRLATAQENNNKRAINSLQRQLVTNQQMIDPIQEQLHFNIENAKQLKSAAKSAEDQKKAQEDIIKLEEANKKEQERKKMAFDAFMLSQKQSGELIQAAIDGNEKEVQLQHDINNAVAIHGKHNRQKITDILKANSDLRDQKNAIDENTRAAEELKSKFDQIGKSVENDIVQNLTDAVMGAQTLGQALTNVLKNFQRQLIEMALTQAVSGIGGFFGGFLKNIFGRGTALNDIQNPNIKGAAKGGRIPAGQLTLVGEEGMELFVPSKSGTVIPNHALGGTTNVVVNVDASGSSVEGDDESANQLGQLIAAAVQSELVNQQMQGGLLS